MPGRNGAESPEDRETKIEALPEWAQQYIRELESLNRTLQQQLQAALAQDTADLYLARQISDARDRLAQPGTGPADLSESADPLGEA